MTVPINAITAKQTYTRGEELLNDLKTIPEIQTLITEAEQVSHPIKILIQDKENSNACFMGNKILIRVTDFSKKQALSAKEQRYMAVLELWNMVHQKEFPSFALTSERYAKAIEKVEFKSLAKTQDVIRKVSTSYNTLLFSNDNLERRDFEKLEFEEYYRDFLDDAHKERYRKEWRSVILKIAIIVGLLFTLGIAAGVSVKLTD